MLKDSELARVDPSGLVVRDEPLRVRWEFEELASNDGQTVECVLIASVRARPEAVERRALREVLMADRPNLTSADVAAHFAVNLRAAAQRAVSTLLAEPLVEGEPAAMQTVVEAVTTAGKAMAFACGLELLPPWELTVTSRSLQTRRIRQMQEALVEQQKAGQLAGLRHAAELLKQFESIAVSSPGLSAGRMLEQINPADRGTLLKTLLLAGANRPGAAAGLIWAVAGQHLVRIDPSSFPSRIEALALSEALGPLRSVRLSKVAGRASLLVGAQKGLALIDRQDLSKQRVFLMRDIVSFQGFNGAVELDDEQFVATHGEAGVAVWHVEQPSSPIRVIGLDALENESPRHLTKLEPGRLLFAAGAGLWLFDGSRVQRLPETSSAEVVAILADAQDRLIVRGNGTIERLSVAAPTEIRTVQQRAASVRAAGLLPWLSGQRVLLAIEDGSLLCVGLEDQLISEYVSGHRGLRMVGGSARVVAGVSPDRQRLVLWNSWEGQAPADEVYLTSLTRHRIADTAME